MKNVTLKHYKRLSQFRYIANKKGQTSQHVFSKNFKTAVPFKKQKLYFTHFSLPNTYLFKKSIVYIKA
jgi:hypothetical protein